MHSGGFLERPPVPAITRRRFWLRAGLVAVGTGTAGFVLGLVTGRRTGGLHPRQRWAREVGATGTDAELVANWKALLQAAQLFEEDREVWRAVERLAFHVVDFDAAAERQRIAARLVIAVEESRRCPATLRRMLPSLRRVAR